MKDSVITAQGVFLSLILLCQLQGLWAKEVAEPPKQSETGQAENRLPVIVVSATRTEKLLEDVPIPVQVISDREIEQQNAKNLGEALRHAKGILVQPIHGKTGDAIKIQGIDSDRILVLVDGERVTASTGSSVDLSQVAVSDVAQIEIVKGASSALYGSSAMGGVVNVITKTPEPGWQGSLQSSLSDYGDKGFDGVTVDQYDVEADLAYQGEGIWSFLTASSRNSEGYEIENEGLSLNGPDGYKNNFSFGVGGKPSENTSMEISQRSYLEDHIIYEYARVPGQGFVNRSERASTHRTRVKTDWKPNQQFSTQLQGYMEQYENDREDSIRRENQIDSYNLDWQNQWHVNVDNLLTAGVNVNGESLTQVKDGVSELDLAECGADLECKRNAEEVYFQWDHFVNDNLEILGGFRFQEDSDFGSHSSPKISAMYTMEAGKTVSNVRASVGNGYRVPNLKERYYIFDHSHLGYMVIGNPRLEPEENISYQLGFDISSAGAWAYDINLFYNDMEQFIQSEFSHQVTQNNRPVAVYAYQNIAESRTYGVELSALYRIHSYSFRGNYQNLKSEDKNSQLHLVKNPEHLLKLGVEKRLLNNKASVLLQSQYQSESFVDAANTIESPGHTVTDIKFNYHWSDRFRYFAGIDNVSDEHRNPVLVARGGDLRPVPGRKVYLGAQYTF